MGRTVTGSVQRCRSMADAISTPTANALAHVATRTSKPSNTLSRNRPCETIVMIVATASIDSMANTRTPAPAARIAVVDRSPDDAPSSRLTPSPMPPETTNWPALNVVFSQPRRCQTWPKPTAPPRATSASNGARNNAMATRKASSRWMLSPWPSCDSRRGMTWRRAIPTAKVTASQPLRNGCGVTRWVTTSVASPPRAITMHSHLTSRRFGPCSVSAGTSGVGSPVALAGAAAGTGAGWGNAGLTRAIVCSSADWGLRKREKAHLLGTVPGRVGGPGARPALRLHAGSDQLQWLPSHSRFDHWDPVHCDPVHWLPAHCEPVHWDPVHCEPAHWLPAHWLPAHWEPVHWLPAHCEPLHCDPVHWLPVHCEPVHWRTSSTGEPAHWAAEVPPRVEAQKGVEPGVGHRHAVVAEQARSRWVSGASRRRRRMRVLVGRVRGRCSSWPVGVDWPWPWLFDGTNRPGRCSPASAGASPGWG